MFRHYYGAGADPLGSARAKFKDKKYSEAIEQYNNNLCNNYTSDIKAMAFAERGFCYEKLGEYNNAIKDYTGAIEIAKQGEQGEFYSHLAYCFYCLGKFQDAITATNEALKLKKLAISYYYLGEFYFAIGKISLAQEDISKAIQLEDNSLSDNNLKNRLLTLLGSPKNTDEDYQRVIMRSNTQGLLFEYCGQSEKAKEYYQRAITEDSTCGYAYANRALITANVEDANKATGYFNDEIKRNKHCFIFYAYRGIAQLGLKNYKFSISDFNQSISLLGGSKVGWIYHRRGQAKHLSGDYKGALLDYLEAVGSCFESSLILNSLKDLINQLFVKKQIFTSTDFYFFTRRNILKILDESIKNIGKENNLANIILYGYRSIFDYRGVFGYRDIFKYTSVSDFNHAINLIPEGSTEFSWIYYGRAREKFRQGDFIGAILDYISSLKEQRQSSFMIDELKNVINKMIETNQDCLQGLLENNETLLHFACAMGYEEIIKLLIKEAERKKISIQYILTKNSNNQTAVRLLIANRHFHLIPLLTDPLITAQMQSPFSVIQHDSLSQAVQLSIKRRDRSSVIDRKLHIKDIACDYLGERLQDEDVAEFQENFEDSKFDSLMDEYQEKISQDSAGESLKTEGAKLALAKLKYDLVHNNKQQSITRVALTGSDKFDFILKFLQGIFGVSLAKKLGEYSPFLDELMALFSLLKELNHSGCLSSVNLESMIAKLNQNRKYIKFIAPCFQLFNILKNKKYENIFLPIIDIFDLWSDQFGTEEEKQVAGHLRSLANDLRIYHNSDVDFLQKIYLFSQKTQTQAFQLTTRFLGYQRAVEKSMCIILQEINHENSPEALRQFQWLIFLILTNCKVYSESKELKQTIIEETKNIVWADFKKLQGVESYKPLLKVFRQIAQHGSIEALINNVDIINSVDIFENLLDEFNSDKTKTKFIILFKFLSKILIDCRNQTDNKIFSYVGLFCLAILQLLAASDKISKASSAIEIAQVISHELEGILKEILLTFKFPETYRLTAMAILVNSFIKIVYQLYKEEINRDNCLKIVHLSIYNGNRNMAQLLLDKYSNDYVLESIKKYFEIAEAATAVGETLNFVYNLVTGKAIQNFSRNLDKLLPAGMSSVIVQGLQHVLFNVPLVGNSFSTLSILEEVRSVKKSFELHVDKAEQRVTLKMITIGRHLSTQLDIGFKQIRQDLRVLYTQLTSIESQLKELQKLLLENRKIIIDFTFSGDIGTLIKNINSQIAVSDFLGKKISKEAFKTYKELLNYLLPGATPIEGLKTVYSPHVVDSFTLLWQALSRNDTRNDILPADLHSFPCFELWLQLVSTLTEFLDHIKLNALFAESFNVCDLFQIFQIFQNATNVLYYLQILKHKRSAELFFSKVAVKEVELEDFMKLASYCKLLGIPLLGIPLLNHGENIKLWSETSEVGLAWRETMAKSLLKKFPSISGRNIIDDTINTTAATIYTFGCLLIQLVKQYIIYLCEQLEKPNNNPERINAMIGKSAEIGQSIFDILSRLNCIDDNFGPFNYDTSLECHATNSSENIILTFKGSNRVTTHFFNRPKKLWIETITEEDLKPKSIEIVSSSRRVEFPTEEKHEDNLEKPHTDRTLTYSRVSFFVTTAAAVITTVGYVRKSVGNDGNCGYIAFGITRDKAHELLNVNDNIDAVRDLLKPAIKEFLLREEFFQYLQVKKVISKQITLLDIQNNLDTYANNFTVIAAFIDFDVREGRLDVGWAHPATLQALAHIQEIEIYIWRLGEDGRLIPHRYEGQYDYAHYTPPTPKQRTDLLFVNSNHFERLEFEGYEKKYPSDTDVIYPLKIHQNFFGDSSSSSSSSSASSSSNGYHSGARE